MRGIFLRFTCSGVSVEILGCTGLSDNFPFVITGTVVNLGDTEVGDDEDEYVTVVFASCALHEDGMNTKEKNTRCTEGSHIL